MSLLHTQILLSRHGTAARACCRDYIADEGDMGVLSEDFSALVPGLAIGNMPQQRRSRRQGTGIGRRLLYDSRLPLRASIHAYTS